MSVDENAQWYVIHTYSGYENKVKANIEKIVETRGMQDLIQEVSVPVADTVEIKNGQKKVVPRKVFPGYVLLKMVMNDDTWFIVRNTRGVTSFVGPASKPIPLTDREIRSMGIETVIETVDISVSDSVKIKSGAFEGSMGIVKEVNHGKKTVIVRLSVFGRETPVELDFMQVERMA